MALVAISKIGSLIGTIHYVTFAFDPRLSHKACMAVQQYVALGESNGIYHPHEIMKEIPHYVEAVESIELQQLPFHTAVMSIHAYKPLMRINDDQVLLDNHAIVVSDYYALYALASLKKIALAQPVPSRVSSDLLASLKQCIIKNVFDYYTFYVASENEWYLHDRNDPGFTVRCNATSLPIDSLQTAYEHLKMRIQTKNYRGEWVADIRFHDQIILSMKRGAYGKKRV